jgi:hypothetical protein
MTTTRTTLMLAFVGAFGTSACRGKLPCPDCGDDVAAEGDDDTPMPDIPVPDLPCGGADLMTDNLNCGTCGHECVNSWYRETEYEAGTCKAGVCGPASWSTCTQGDKSSPWQNCSDICTSLNRVCVPNGCAGLTGLVFTLNFDGWGCSASHYTPAAEISGGCDEPIPWMNPGDGLMAAQCCCDYQ